MTAILSGVGGGVGIVGGGRGCWVVVVVGWDKRADHYDDVIMSAIASQITSLTIVYSTVYPGADLSKHQSSASLAFVWGIHRGPVNSPHKWPVTRKRFSFDDVIMCWCLIRIKYKYWIDPNSNHTYVMRFASFVERFGTWTERTVTNSRDSPIS